MYVSKKIDEEVYSIIPNEYKEHVEFLESLYTVDSLMVNKSFDLKYTNLIYEVKVTYESMGRLLSFYIGKNSEKFNLEFNFNTTSVRHLRRKEIIKHLEQYYDFYINDDYFKTRFHNVKNYLTIFLDFSIEPSIEMLKKFCNDFYNNKIEERVIYDRNTFTIYNN